MASNNPAVVFPEARKVAIVDRPMPEPGPGEVLIRTSCTLISTGTELMILNGRFPPDSHWSAYGKFPFFPGYDNIGEVAALGAGVDKSWLGKRVASTTRHARYTLGTAADLVAVPQGVEEAQASFFTISVIVMNGLRRGAVTWGEAVVVYGMGLLGQLAARLAHHAGARPVVAVDVAAARLARLPRNVPGLLPVNAAEQDVVAVVQQSTRGRMADCVIELTGDPELIPKEFAVLRRLGRFVVLSSPRGRTNFDFHDLCNLPSFTIIGAHNHSHPPAETPQTPWAKPRHAEIFFDLLAARELDLSPLVSHREPYTRAPELYAALLADRSQAMGVVLDWK